jgi:hypothetical protein
MSEQTNEAEVLTREVLVEKSANHGINYIVKHISDPYFHLEIKKIGKWHIFFQWSHSVAARTFGDDTVLVRALVVNNAELIQTPYHWGDILLKKSDAYKQWFIINDKNRKITGFFFGFTAMPIECLQHFYNIVRTNIQFFYKKDITLTFPSYLIHITSPTTVKKNIALGLIKEIGNNASWKTRGHMSSVYWEDRNRLSFLEEVQKFRKKKWSISHKQRTAVGSLLTKVRFG